MATDRPFTIIAHRGFSAQAPENTFAAFDLAKERGFDNIELDAQLSSDGTAFVLHDELLDRTTSGSGLLSEHAASDLELLDAGSWFGPAFAGEQVPKLVDVLSRYAGSTRLHVELKSDDPHLPVVVHRAPHKRGPDLHTKPIRSAWDHDHIIPS